MRKENGPVRLSLSVVCLLALASAASATDKTANNTSIAPYGAVTIKEGYPLAKNIDAIKSNLELSRASELFLWALPMNASYAIRDGVFEASGGYRVTMI